MAVIQISRIQVRRGLQENLPQLSSGELGWSVDEQRLWIGNGTIVEGAPEIGNTEILTSNSDVLNAIQSYVFRGQESGYTSKTGATLTTPIQRSLQNKFDEQISVRDFGAVGDGVTDDTAALQRAIDQIYSTLHYISPRVRRQIHVPAGTYKISSTLTIPSYANIFGDGALSTIIKQTGDFEVIKLRDNKGQVESAIGNDFAETPFQISISNLTLENTTDYNVAVIESAKDILFHRVKFKGAATTPVNTLTTIVGLLIKSGSYATTNVIANQCWFAQATYGVYSQGDVKNVVTSECSFDTLYQGVALTSNVSTPQSVKVTSSNFNNISKEAIYVTGGSSLTSAFNLFRSVGHSEGVNIIGPIANTSVISWSNSNNFSIGDIFERDAANIALQPLISFNSVNTAPYTQFINSGSLTSTPGKIETLAGNVSTATNTSVVLSSLSQAVIDYKILRGTNTRSGTMKVTQLTGTVTFEDDYVETNSTGVELGFTGFDNDAVLTYTTSNTSPISDATFNYTIRSFI